MDHTVLQPAPNTAASQNGIKILINKHFKKQSTDTVSLCMNNPIHVDIVNRIAAGHTTRFKQRELNVLRTLLEYTNSDNDEQASRLRFITLRYHGVDGTPYHIVYVRASDSHTAYIYRQWVCKNGDRKGSFNPFNYLAFCAYMIQILHHHVCVTSLYNEADFSNLRVLPELEKVTRSLHLNRNVYAIAEMLFTLTTNTPWMSDARLVADTMINCDIQSETAYRALFFTLFDVHWHHGRRINATASTFRALPGGDVTLPLGDILCYPSSVSCK